MASNRSSDGWPTQTLLLSCAIGFALLALASWAPQPATAKGDHEFVGYAKCKTCHGKTAIGNQYGTWRESKHAKAFDTLATDKAKKWAADAGIGDPQTDARCVKCHETAHGVPDEQVAKKFDRKAGVQCEACHGPGKDYRKKSVMIDRDKAIAKGLIIPTEAVCTACHNDESPAWDPQRYTLADGSKAGFDFEQAAKEIAHPVPESYDPSGEGEAD